jgi:FixJ family two-component response regulator
MTPVILITAMCDDEVRAEAKRWGAATIVEKPFEADSLLTAVVNATWLDAMRRASGALRAAERPAATASASRERLHGACDRLS